MNLDLDDATTFECRLRRALVQRFRGMTKKKIESELRRSSSNSNSNRTDTADRNLLPESEYDSKLDKFLIDALNVPPTSVFKALVPPKKPLGEVASYLKTTDVSRSKRLSFLVSSRSWSPFKAMWIDIDENNADRGSDILNSTGDSSSRLFKKTESSKQKRQSFYAIKAAKALQNRKVTLSCHNVTRTLHN
jgi:hypothetical protein